MARKAFVEIVGDARSGLAALKQTISGTKQLTVEQQRLATNATKSAAAQVQAAVRTQTRLKEQVAAYKQIAQAAEKGSREQIAAANLAARAQGKLASSVGSSAREQQTFARAARQANGEFGSLGRGAIAGSGVIRQLGRSVAFASASFLGTAGFVAGAKASVTAAATFDNSLRKIIGLGSGTAASVARMRGELLKLGPAVGKTPQELAEALYQISSSGVEASQQMAVLTVSAKAATAGLGDTSVVADAVTSAMNAYGASTLSAQKATDILAAAVREGKGEASQFAPVIGNVSALAAQLGVSFNDVAAALAAQTRLGTDAETASTQLQAFFSGLLKTMPKAEKEMQAFGLSSKGLREELAGKGLLATLETIKGAFGDNTSAMAKAFPNIRALRGLLSLVGKQADETAGIFNRMRDTTGSLQTAFGAVSNDTAVKFGKAQAAIQATEITIGAALTPTVLKATDAMTKWLGTSKHQAELQRDVTKAARDAVTVFTDVAGAVRRVRDAFGGWKPLLEGLLALKVASIATGWVGAISRLGGSAATAEGKVGLLRGSLGTLTAAPYVITLEVVGLEAAAKKIKQLQESYLKPQGAATSSKVLQALVPQYAGVYQNLRAHGDSPQVAYAALFKVINERLKGANPDMIADIAAAAIKAGTQRGANLFSTDAADRRGVGSTTTTPTRRTSTTTSTTTATHTGTGGDIPDFSKWLDREFGLAIAKAASTVGKSDDLRVDRQVQAAITKAIKQGRLSGKALRDAYTELGSVSGDLASAAKDAATKATDAATKQRDALAAQLKSVRQQAATLQQTIAQRLDTARGQIGDVFSGPVINPTPLSLGATGPGIGTLTADLTAQTRAARSFSADLATIAKRGGSGAAELVKELRGQGQSAAPEAHTIATATGGDFQRFMAAFGAREKEAQREANVVKLNARAVTLQTRVLQLEGKGGPSAYATDARNRPIVVHTTVELDKRRVGQAVTEYQARRPQRPRT